MPNNTNSAGCLVLVDDALSAKNPSTASLVAAIPLLKDKGWDIEFWGRRLDPELLPYVSHRRTFVFSLGAIPAVWNVVIRHVVDGLRWLRIKDKSKHVFLTTGGRFFLADIQWFHFYNKAWFRIQGGDIKRGGEPSLRKYLSLWGCFVDWLGIVTPLPKLILPVSDSIGAEILSDHKNSVVETLPNCVDLSRFKIELRKEKREALREGFGFKNDETILLFVSQGHFTRKGLWLAFEAIYNLRVKGETNFRFVILGGNEPVLQLLIKHLDAIDLDWSSWVTLVGWTKQVPEYMAAADALFFPSYFEAFSLVEIEAAAMALPLVLTPHHGSEMILEDGVNGYFCKYSIDDIGEVLCKLRLHPLDIQNPSLGRALTVSQWAEEFDKKMRNILKSK